MVTTAEATEGTGTPDAPPAKKSRTRKGPANKPAAGEKKTRKSKPMTDEHKAALAEGREQGRIVDNYLVALETNRPKRGRKVTPESRQKKLDEIERDLLTASGVERLKLLQLQKNLQAQQAEKKPENDLPALEKEFIRVAAAYAAKQGIVRSTFVDMGVPVPVLKAAGLKGTRGPGSKAEDEDDE